MEHLTKAGGLNFSVEENDSRQGVNNLKDEIRYYTGKRLRN